MAATAQPKPGGAVATMEPREHLVVPGALQPGVDGRIILRKNQDRRLRGGHPWVFSNEIASYQHEPPDGGIVDIHDYRGAFLGRAYINRHSLIAARVLTRGRDPIDAEFFVRRLERAVRYRDQVAPGVEALRLVHSEADQLPGLVVDRYGDWLSVQITTLGMERRSELVRAALEQVLKPKGVLRIADSPLRLLEGLPLERGIWWGEVPESIELTLEGFRVEAALHSGQKTGLFLDQRENRRFAERFANGQRVLDLFAYQGEWALHAARGGATEVVAVDSSQPALDAAARNAERNGVADRIQFKRGDVFDVVRQFEREGQRFGLIVLDPPALVKSRGQIAAGARGYRDLNRAAMAMLADGGTLITSSCSHHLDDTMFQQVLLEAARAAHRPLRVIAWTGESPDHPRLLAVPETHYLKCAVLQAV